MYERELCISEPFWGYSLMVYNLFLLLLSATLVFFRGRREGDKIAGTAAAMNESTHVAIAVAVYNTFVLSIAGFAFTFIPDPGIQYALVTLTIVAATTVVVCLMFLPKVCLCLPCTS